MILPWPRPSILLTQGCSSISFLLLLFWSMQWPRSTRQASYAHSYCVELSNARINRFSDGFFPSTSSLWNSLPSSIFSASFNLPSFKRQVYYHLRDQIAWFFFSVHIYYYYFFFLNILAICFILITAFLFLFLGDTDSRKSTLCLFCVPIHKKRAFFKFFVEMPKMLGFGEVLKKLFFPHNL